MRWHKLLPLRLKVLTPVVVGTGEKCTSLGFVPDGTKVLVVDEHRFIRLLTEKQRQLLLDWLDESLPKATLNHFLRDKATLNHFLRDKLKMSQPAQWLRQQQAVRYELPLASKAQHPPRFFVCLKTPDHRPYIPGSEIKGALRTAVLAAMLTGNALDQLVDEIDKISPKPQSQRELNQIGQKTEWKLLRAKAAEAMDAHNDLFRGLSISDSEPFLPSSLRLYAAKRLGMTRNVTVFTEAIAPENETKVTLSIASPDRWLEAAGLTGKGEWLDWNKLAEALYEHANAVLDFLAQKFPQMKQHIQELKEQNQEDAPLLRLGWGQGFLSVTMTAPLCRQNRNAYEALVKALAQAIGKYQRAQPKNFPKTVWAALDQNDRPFAFFGWLKIVPT